MILVSLEEGICSVDSCRSEVVKNTHCEDHYEFYKPIEDYDYSVDFKHPPIADPELEEAFKDFSWYEGTVGNAVMWDEGDPVPVEELRRLINLIAAHVKEDDISGD